MTRLLWALPWVLSLLACERTTNLVSTRDDSRMDGAVPAQDADPPPPVDATPPPLVVSDAGVVFCGEAPCACSNGLDDDGDELIDGFDDECTGPYDQDEETFATGEMKPGNPFCSDCFFDGNASAADDTCNIATSCIESGNASGGVGACRSCDPSASCVNNCLPRTPNGCDCFGCCEVDDGEGNLLTIQLVDTCSIEDLKDVERCPRCELSNECRNPCGRCELCPGKTLADLPADCAGGGGPGFSCDEGTVCGPGLPCPSTAYCGQGCCRPIVL